MAKKTTKTMKALGPKHVKTTKAQPKPKAADVIESVAVEVAAVEVPQPAALAVGQTVAYDHPSCLGAGKSGVILAVDGPKAKVQFGGGTRLVLLKKLVVFPASA